MGAQHSTTYSYDSANQLTGMTARDGRQRTFGYDQDGRETSETWLNSQGQAIYTATYVYDSAGQLTNESDPFSAYPLSYDNDGRLTKVDNSGTPTMAHVILTYAYDSFNRRTSLSDNFSGSVTYGYDSDSRLTSETMTVSGTAGPQVTYGYDAASRLTQITRSVSGGNNVNTTLAYDKANRLIGMTHSYSVNGSIHTTITLASYTYAYDKASEVSSYTGPEGGALGWPQESQLYANGNYGFVYHRCLIAGERQRHRFSRAYRGAFRRFNWTASRSFECLAAHRHKDVTGCK